MAALQSMPHVRLTMREIRYRVSGTNLLPHEAWVDTFENAVALIRKPPELVESRRQVDGICARQPAESSTLAHRSARARRTVALCR